MLQYKILVMDEKIKVSIIDIDKVAWFRRPAASIDLSDNRLECEYLYLVKDRIKSPQLDTLPIRNGQLRSIKLDADYAIIFSYRIPELVLIQNNPHVKFLYVQHGYYPDILKRSVFGIFRKLDRIHVYFVFLLKYFFARFEFVRLLDILGIWFVAKYKAKSILSPFKCFVFDKSWERFHVEKLGWKSSQYKQLKFYEPKPIIGSSSYSLQYVAQTLVEDGRLSQKILNATLNRYISNNSIQKLCILAHPRTDESIYTNLDCEISFEYGRCFNIPTIGHYSSLMLYLAENGVPVSVIGDEHIEIPEDFHEKLIQASETRLKQFTNNVEETFLNDEIH